MHFDLKKVAENVLNPNCTEKKDDKLWYRSSSLNIVLYCCWFIAFMISWNPLCYNLQIIFSKLRIIELKIFGSHQFRTFYLEKIWLKYKRFISICIFQWFCFNVVVILLGKFAIYNSNIEDSLLIRLLTSFISELLLLIFNCNTSILKA